MSARRRSINPWLHFYIGVGCLIVTWALAIIYDGGWGHIIAFMFLATGTLFWGRAGGIFDTIDHYEERNRHE